MRRQRFRRTGPIRWMAEVRGRMSEIERRAAWQIAMLECFVPGSAEDAETYPDTSDAALQGIFDIHYALTHSLIPYLSEFSINPEAIYNMAYDRANRARDVGIRASFIYCQNRE